MNKKDRGIEQKRLRNIKDQEVLLERKEGRKEGKQLYAQMNGSSSMRHVPCQMKDSRSKMLTKQCQMTGSN